MPKLMMRTQQGQGLIEILITAVVIIIAVVALLNFQGNLAYNDSLVQARALATTLAEQKIEQLRDFNVLTTQSPYTAYQNIASGSSTYAGPTTTYTITWTVTTVASPSYKTLNVTVSWTDRRGISQSVQLVTDVAGIAPVISATVMY
jgi:type IV pilus assembly protein PilV